MNLYNFIYTIFDFMACRTMPEDDDDTIEEMQTTPHRFVMIR